MLGMPDAVVHAVGRVTIAAGEVELVLAMISASQTTDGNAFVILAKPGEPLRAARRSVRSMASSNVQLNSWPSGTPLSTRCGSMTPLINR